MPKLPGVLGYEPAYSTYDINAGILNARDRKLPVRPSFFSGIVPQVSAQDAAINRPEPVERASLFPLATYPDGSTRLALPGMIAEDIPRAFTAPARAYRGEIADEDMIAEGLNFGGTMAMGGSVVPKPSNAAGMFGGRLAKTADHAKLATAEKMAAEGAPREAIWRDTGWFKGVDGKWRFEIDDSNFKFKDDIGDGILWPRIRHEDLLSAYPDLQNAQFRRSGTGGEYRPPYSYAGLDAPERISLGHNIPKPDSTLLHEMQHAVQRREDFASGSNPRLITADDVASERARLASSKDNDWSSVGLYDPATVHDQVIKNNLYKRAAGETEARAVQARQHLTPEQRSARPPWLDYDVPESQQIVRFNANATESAAPGVVMAEASRAPRVRAYHGTNEDFTRFDPARMGSRGLTDEGAFFFGKSPDLANAYADGEFSVPQNVYSDIVARNTTPQGKMRMADINRELQEALEQTKAGRVIPTDIDTSKFGTWNMPGYRWESDEGARLKKAIDKAKAEGKSGLTINGMEDATGIRDTQYAVWQPGNVYSATTGDLLFENGANAAAPGVIVSEAARAPRPVQMEVPFFRGSGHAQTSVDYSRPYWGTTDRATADFYARSMAQAEGSTPNVTPAVARFRNPMLVDAQGAGFSEIPFDGKRWSTDDLAAAAKERGHDGLVIDRLYDGGRWNPDEGLPATVAALGPGTVSSAFDPNTILYANSRSSSAPGVLAAEAADKPDDSLMLEILRRYGARQ